MRLSADDLTLLAQCAISAACQAGQLIARHSQRAVVVNSKRGASSLAAQVVTEIDHWSQDIILQTLRPTCDRFDLALLAEESPDDQSRLHRDYFWCIDPLDGTLPFIEGLPGYSVSIALVSRAGQAMIGVIYDPLTQTLYRAIHGQGAWQHHQAMEPAKPADILTFITDKSFVDDPFYAATTAALDSVAADLGYAGAVLKRQGGAALNACQVLMAAPACYFKFPKPQSGGGSVWDYAATVCLFRECLAPVSDIYGEPLRLNPEGSTYMNHCGVLYCSNHAIAERMTLLYHELSSGL